MQVISFEDYRPAARFDGNPWTQVRVQEATSQSGPWTTIDTQVLDPVDTDPTDPLIRNLTTDDANDAMGLWYRLLWVDAVGALSPTLPVQNEPPETLKPTALCTDEDVRHYLNIKEEDISEDDRNTLVRLVNAASDTFTDESQRIWKVDPASTNVTRLYLLDGFDLSVGRLRIDDCTDVTSVSYGGFNSLDPYVPFTSYWPWQAEPDQPITAIVLTDVSTFSAGGVISVDAVWGWPYVPEKVRQSVIYTAAEWYARDVEKFSSTFSLDQGRILMPQVLPRQVQAEAESYRRWRVA